MSTAKIEIDTSEACNAVDMLRERIEATRTSLEKLVNALEDLKSANGTTAQYYITININGSVSEDEVQRIVKTALEAVARDV